MHMTLSRGPASPRAAVDVCQLSPLLLRCYVPIASTLLHACYGAPPFELQWCLQPRNAAVSHAYRRVTSRDRYATRSLHGMPLRTHHTSRPTRTLRRALTVRCGCACSLLSLNPCSLLSVNARGARVHAHDSLAQYFPVVEPLHAGTTHVPCMYRLCYVHVTLSMLRAMLRPCYVCRIR